MPAVVLDRACAALRRCSQILFAEVAAGVGAATLAVAGVVVGVAFDDAGAGAIASTADGALGLEFAPIVLSLPGPVFAPASGFASGFVSVADPVLVLSFARGGTGDFETGADGLGEFVEGRGCEVCGARPMEEGRGPRHALL